MKNASLLTLCIAASLAPLSASAGKYYAAKPTESVWTVTVDTPIECRIEHAIPNYGMAMFSSRASKKINLDFELEMRRPMGQTQNVSLVSMPPVWLPGEPAEYIDRLRFYKQFNGFVDGQTAWSMLSELENGRYPTFSFKEWQSRGKRVEIALSSVSFQQPYNEFSGCISRLLPYSFEDIAFTVLHYDENGAELNKASMARLAQIAEFVRYSPDIDLVLMATYTDNRGAKVANQRLSEIRAQKLEAYFMSLGLPKDRIQVEAYGERRPIAENESPIGRNKNRRVVISLGRTII
ncbi:OmpA family protein [Grimontia hollisae]|uniref:Sodium-type flagellar protein MotY n=2 Tax=Grimontia hollisae TaxID=673 RepID=D0I707_GRIHO|nr:OmpA family protein [Grimontia hollisae]AMG32202.1 OmpA family protein [Grimontia hollisae]EEY72426.1 sodium-type flagellar protein MotY precursor [Grimontia hollisae CIP 101886]MDF2185764.1 OmpA family protein [Grimontia hollisae]STO45717.1 Photosystem I P700 chlorophyll a apoprotein A2 [Grimontia hollisae]STO58008.1 Photosystem I P700 chlorophyll a apoprotein A2 [Grimontia hollisae]